MTDPFGYMPLNPGSSPGNPPTRRRSIAESNPGYQRLSTPPPSPSRSAPTSPIRFDNSKIEFITIGEGGYTQTIEEDMDRLADLGFIIDFGYGHLGSGFYGDVYKGVYGQNVCIT